MGAPHPPGSRPTARFFQNLPHIFGYTTPKCLNFAKIYPFSEGIKIFLDFTFPFPDNSPRFRFATHTFNMKTFFPKDPGENRQWLIFDAADRPVGRLAVQIANALRGKDKPDYTPWVDTGASVIVINASKVKLSGSKDAEKTYERYSRWRGGHVITPAAVVRAKNPERMILEAVKGMLPGNKLARGMMRRLHVYAGAEHPHEAQQPVAR